MRTLRYKLPLLDEDIDMNISKSFVSVSAVALSALGIAATLGAPQAFAADSKVYPGAMCVQWAGPDTKGLNWSSVTNFGGGGSIYLDCPAVHDANSIASGWVRATDRHQNLGVSCGLYSVYRAADSGVWFWTGGTKSTTGGGNDAPVQQLGYGGAGANGISHYFFSCSIPPTYAGSPSEIHTYYVNEY